MRYLRQIVLSGNINNFRNVKTLLGTNRNRFDKKLLSCIEK